MNRYFLMYGLVVLAALGGCTRSEVQAEGDSTVELRATVDASLNVRASKASAYDIPLPDDCSYTVRRVSDNGVVAEGPSVDGLGALALMAGSYKFEVASVGAASLDRPSYKGSKTVAVEKNKTTQVEVSAKLASAVVAVRFSDAVRSGFASYSATVTAGSQSATFDASTPDKLIYLPAPATDVRCEISVTTEQGIRFSVVETADALAAADLLEWTIDVAPYTETPTDPLVVELAVDRTLNETKTELQLELKPTATGLPTVTGRQINIVQPIGVRYYPRTTTTVRIDLSTPAGLEKVLLMFPIGQAGLEGGPAPQGVLDLLDPATDCTAWGIAFDEGGAKGASNTLLNLTAMTGKMPGTRTGAENFDVTIGLLDKNGTYTATKVTFNVYGVLFNTPTHTGATEIDWFGVRGERNKVNVALSSTYNVDEVPDGLAFQYRKVGETSWELIEPIVQGKTVRGVLALVADGSQWEYRLSSNEEENGTIVQLPKLPTYPTITNMSFDQWPGGDLENPTGWGSPNYGGVLGIGRVLSTTRAPGWNGIGLGVQIKSGDAAGQFASGGLFTGSMSVDMGNPYKSAKVGIAFAGRPKKLKGYYKYNSVKIHRISNPDMVGNGAKDTDMDMCEVAIKLERWGSGTYNVRWRDGFFGTPASSGKSYLDINGAVCHGRVAKVVDYDGTSGTVDPDIRRNLSVGYGQLTSRGQAEWTPFEINIEYYQNVLPDHLIITAVSSAWGGYMCGAQESTLWLDNLEFVY